MKHKKNRLRKTRVIRILPVDFSNPKSKRDLEAFFRDFDWKRYRQIEADSSMWR